VASLEKEKAALEEALAAARAEAKKNAEATRQDARAAEETKLAPRGRRRKTKRHGSLPKTRPPVEKKTYNDGAMLSIPPIWCKLICMVC